MRKKEEEDEGRTVDRTDGQMDDSAEITPCRRLPGDPMHSGCLSVVAMSRAF